MQASPVAGEPRRLISLDAFRGRTIAATVLVVNPGSYALVYRPLKASLPFARSGAGTVG